MNRQDPHPPEGSPAAEFRDTLTGEQQLTIALLVCDYEAVIPDDRDDVTDEERDERMVEGLTPLAAYLHVEGIEPGDFHPLHARKNVLYPAWVMADAIGHPEAFLLPDRPGTEIAHAVLKNIGLIGGLR